MELYNTVPDLEKLENFTLIKESRVWLMLLCRRQTLSTRVGNLDTGNLNRQARLGAADTWATGRGSMKEWRDNDKLFKRKQVYFLQWEGVWHVDTERERFSTRNFLLEFINIRWSGMVCICLWKWGTLLHSPACVLDLLGALALFTISLFSWNIVRLV